MVEVIKITKRLLESTLQLTRKGFLHGCKKVIKCI